MSLSTAQARASGAADDSGALLLAAGTDSDLGAAADILAGWAQDDAPGSATGARVLTSGETLTGELEAMGDRDWFAVDLVAGRTYIFEMDGPVNGRGTVEDPYLRLMSPSGTMVAFDDDNGQERNSRLVFTATESGRFHIVASAWDDRYTGTYTLSWRQEDLWTADPAGIRSSDIPTDPLFAQQWHLQSGLGGVNALAVWSSYTGQGVRVAVMDSGADHGHRDLDDRIDRTRSVDTANLQPGGRPLRYEDNHGTAVSGTIVAERNGVGGVGVAYNASLVMLYDTLSNTAANQARQAANAFTWATQNADVLNNSWGFGRAFEDSADSAFIDNFRNSTMAGAGTALQEAARTGRSGLGLIVVQSAGNARAHGDNTNTHNFQNSRFAITVAATSSIGLVTSFSTPGASILVAAPGQSVVTTDRTGTDGYGATDTTTISGTSFSAPIVSGVVALMLEANPRLGYRDVHEILALTARNSDVNNFWVTTGTRDWNGGALRFSHDYGFGLVDARAAVRLAETWTTQAVFTNEAMVQGTSSPNLAIPENTPDGVPSTLQVGAGVRIDRVEVDVAIQHANIGDLTITLTSPSGTTVTLFDRPGRTATRDASTQDNINFTFGATAFLGESSGGTWTLRAIDAAGNLVTGVLTSWTVRAYGDTATTDAMLVFTDEFATLAATETTRRTLTDTDGGTDTINAAAVSARVVLDLSGASASTIGSTGITIQANVFEAAYGGDAGDLLIAGTGGARLGGGRGNDEIRGGSGFDEAVFIGRMSDYQITVGADGTVTVAGTGETDTVTNVERLVFNDRAMTVGQPVWQTRQTAFSLASGGVGRTVRQEAITPIQDPTRGELTTRVTIDGADPGGTAATLRRGWQVGTVADIDGNGLQEIFFFGVDQVSGVGQGFGATWEINAAGQIARTQVQIQMSRQGWEVAGAANLNSRAGDEIIWQNTLTGQKAIWSDTNADGVLDLGWLIENVPVTTDQRVVGTVDLNLDGRRDLVVFDDRTRQVHVHYLQDMGNGAVTSTRSDSFAGWDAFNAALPTGSGLGVFGLRPL